MSKKRIDPIQLEIERITSTIAKISNGSLDNYEAGLLLEEIISANSQGAGQEELITIASNATGLLPENEINANIVNFIFNPEQSTYKPFANEKLKALRNKLKMDN